MALAVSLRTLFASGRLTLQEMSISCAIIATTKLDLFVQRAVKNDLFMNIYRGGIVGLVFESVNLISVTVAGPVHGGSGDRKTLHFFNVFEICG